MWHRWTAYTVTVCFAQEAWKLFFSQTPKLSFFRLIYLQIGKCKVVSNASNCSCTAVVYIHCLPSELIWTLRADLKMRDRSWQRHCWSYDCESKWTFRFCVLFFFFPSLLHAPPPRTVDFVASCYSTESCKCKLRDIACLKWYVKVTYILQYLFKKDHLLTCGTGNKTVITDNTMLYKYILEKSPLFTR